MHTQPTIAGFKAFIAAQPANRPTSHASWNECMVGDYVREACGHEIATAIGPNWCGNYTPVFNDPALRALVQEVGFTDEWASGSYGAQTSDKHTIMDILGDLSADCGLNTYGTTLAYIHQCTAMSTEEYMEFVS